MRNPVLARMTAAPRQVWTPADFADLGHRDTVDKTLQRLARAGTLSRIERGLYHLPSVSRLTGAPAVPDYREVIAAVARRDNARCVIDGMTAANDLGFTTAVPARIEVLTDARLRPIRLGSQEIRFRTAAPSRLFWAGRPAMRVVQALYWLHDMLADRDERPRIVARLARLLADPVHGTRLGDDLRDGLSALPIWMQELLRELVAAPETTA